MARDSNQVFVGTYLDQELLEAVDRGRGTKSRSAFLREAMVEALAKCQIYVDASVAAAPDRAGKGGRPKKTAHVSGFQETASAGGFPGSVVAGEKTRTGKGGRPKLTSDAGVGQKTGQIAGFPGSEAGGVLETPNVGSFQETPNVSGFSDAPPSNVVELPYYGTVAAGLPGGPLDTDDGTHPVPREVLGKHKPADLYVLRVNGRSMEPDYPDGSHILCRRLRDGEYAKKNQDVISNDSNGAVFKRLIYSKDGPKTDQPRKAVPTLASLNPDFPGVVPAADCPIVAVVVGKLGEDRRP